LPIVMLEDAGRERPQPGAVAESKVLAQIRKMAVIIGPRRRMAAPVYWMFAAAVVVAVTIGVVGLGRRANDRQTRHGDLLKARVSIDRSVIIMCGLALGFAEAC
jgi:hypothetical protein